VGAIDFEEVRVGDFTGLDECSCKCVGVGAFTSFDGCTKCVEEGLF